MVKITLISDPLTPNRFVPEELQPLSPETSRWRLAMRSHVWRPPTDVYETNETIVVRVEIAGMQEEDFSISLTDKYLTIRGLRPDVSERRAYHQMEIFFGEFMSEVELPCPVRAEEVTAEYRAGFLRLTFPKIQPRRIRIKD